jgi:CubicO group peptidase (beta-lactamase class C family)
MPEALSPATPESQGVATAAVRELIQAFDGLDGLHSLVLVRHGHVIAEAAWSPFRVDAPQHVYSISKSFTSTAVGFAIAEGLFGLDDRVVELFPESAPAVVDERLAALRVRHLLAMSAGHDWDSMDVLFAAGEGDWVAAFLGVPLKYEPGTEFFYDTGASFVLSALVQKTSGLRLLDYLTPRLFEPLGITGAQWYRNSEGIDFGGFGLCVSARDIAALGQLYLQRGRWGDEQLLSEDWVDAATSFQTDNSTFGGTADWQSGYGYQFWRGVHGYRGDGAFGQYCLVIPEADVVVAITGSLMDMQVPLYPVWQGLLPSLSDAPLPENPDAAAEFAADVARLTVAAPGGARTTDTAKRIDGLRYELESNVHGFHSVSLRIGASSTLIELRAAGVEHELLVGYGEWATHELALWPDEGDRFAGRGGWTGEKRFSARIVALGSPFTIDLDATFIGDGAVELTARQHVSFEAVGPIVLRGTRIGRIA